MLKRDTREFWQLSPGQILFVLEAISEANGPRKGKITDLLGIGKRARNVRVTDHRTRKGK